MRQKKQPGLEEEGARERLEAKVERYTYEFEEKYIQDDPPNGRKWTTRVSEFMRGTRRMILDRDYRYNGSWQGEPIVKLQAPFSTDAKEAPLRVLLRNALRNNDEIKAVVKSRQFKFIDCGTPAEFSAYLQECMKMLKWTKPERESPSSCREEIPGHSQILSNGQVDSLPENKLPEEVEKDTAEFLEETLPF
jgi:hypothetical protein